MRNLFIVLIVLALTSCATTRQVDGNPYASITMTIMDLKRAFWSEENAETRQIIFDEIMYRTGGRNE